MFFQRKIIRHRTLLPLALILLMAIGHRVNCRQVLAAEEIIKRSQKAFFYAGSDMKAKVTMQLITKNGKERLRELTMLRLNENYSGDQKYFMYFHRPADIREMTFMVWNYSDKNDDRWLYMPSIKLVRQIAANDKHSSFVGSDFTYEDVTGREITEDNHILKRQESLNGRQAYLVESIPVDSKGAYFSKKISWIDEENFLPLKEEYYDQSGELIKIFSADNIQEVSGVPTIRVRTMTNVRNGHRTVVTFDDISYNVGLKKEIFSERYLRNAPPEWIN